MNSPIQKPDILSVLSSEGIELKKKGKAFWTLCPLHSEKTPSLKIDSERQHWHCFGCGEHGDVITLIEKLKGLTFRESLKYLGIDPKGSYRPDSRELKKIELFKMFEEWCRRYYAKLCDMSLLLNSAKAKLKTVADVEAYAWLYHLESTWGLHIEILAGNDYEAKLALYEEVYYGQ